MRSISSLAICIRYELSHTAMARIPQSDNELEELLDDPSFWTFDDIPNFDAIPSLDDVGTHAWAVPHIRRGVRLLESAREGHERVHGTAKEKAARWRRYAADHAEEIARGISKEAAYHTVAQNHNVSDRTIRRAVKKMPKIA